MYDPHFFRPTLHKQPIQSKMLRIRIVPAPSRLNLQEADRGQFGSTHCIVSTLHFHCTSHACKNISAEFHWHLTSHSNKSPLPVYSCRLSLYSDAFVLSIWPWCSMGAPHCTVTITVPCKTANQEVHVYSSAPCPAAGRRLSHVPARRCRLPLTAALQTNIEIHPTSPTAKKLSHQWLAAFNKCDSTLLDPIRSQCIGENLCLCVCELISRTSNMTHSIPSLPDQPRSTQVNPSKAIQVNSGKFM